MSCHPLLVFVGLQIISSICGREAPSFYHRSIDQEFRNLGVAGNCPAANLIITDEPLLRLRIRGVGAAIPRSKRVVFAFGEHARELVGPESALHFARLLCGGVDPISPALSSGNASKVASELLASGIEFDILANLNPVVREQVVSGNFCLRQDARGVDINRNYGGAAHWSGKEDEGFAPGETNPGPKPFSEAATQMVRHVLTASSSKAILPASLFIAVHTGEFAMFNAPAWTESADPLFTLPAKDSSSAAAVGPAEAVRRISAVLAALQPKHCPECLVGPLGQNEGFALRGTSLDYAAGLGIPASLIEIYTGSEEMKGFQELEQTMAALNWKHAQKQIVPTSFLQRGHRRSTHGVQPVPVPEVHVPEVHGPEVLDDSQAESCFRQFNPSTREDFDAVLQRWSPIYLDIAKSVLATADASSDL